MSVITISRGSFSGGKMLAECLAAKLGYRCVDRDVVVERAAASSAGVTQQEIREALTKPPGLLERFNHKRYVYLALIQAALAEEVQNGKAIYHGLAGHLLLKAGPHLLRVRIIAPMEFRIVMVRERLKYSRGEAESYIEKVDEERRRWTQYLYGVDWRDPSLYDLVINLEQLHIEQACNLVCNLMLERCFEFTGECKREMDNLVLASQVRAALALDPATSDLEVEAVASRGTVRISGKLSRVSELDEIKRVARAVPGVQSLNLDEMALPARAL
jgi:cytidylate kinase